MTTKRKGSEIPGAEPDSTYVFQRAEDRSVWTKLSLVLDKYKPIVWLAGLVLVAAGFGFKTPSETFSRIHDRLNKLETKELNAEADRTRLEEKVDALIRLRCFEIVDKKLEREAQLVGLDCNAILRGAKP